MLSSRPLLPQCLFRAKKFSFVENSIVGRLIKQSYRENSRLDEANRAREKQRKTLKKQAACAEIGAHSITVRCCCRHRWRRRHRHGCRCQQHGFTIEQFMEKSRTSINKRQALKASVERMLSSLVLCLNVQTTAGYLLGQRVAIDEANSLELLSKISNLKLSVCHQHRISTGKRSLLRLLTTLNTTTIIIAVSRYIHQHI